MKKSSSGMRNLILRTIPALLSAALLLSLCGFSAFAEALPASDPVFASEKQLEEAFETIGAGAEAEGAAFDGYIVTLAPEAENLSETPAEESTEEIAFAENLCVAASAEALLSDYAAEDVVGVEPNYVISLHDLDGMASGQEPNDPYFAEHKQTNLTTMNVPYIWQRGFEGQAVSGSDPVVVAIIDTGINTDHEDFDYSRVLPGHNWLADDDGTVDELAVDDPHGHGTLCASIILSAKDNGLGVAGIVPQAYLLPLKIFSEKDANMSLAISAINYAIEQKRLYESTGGAEGTDVSVINMSFGGSKLSASLEKACQDAVQEGILLVASAGNGGSYEPNYPASYDCVVGVGAVGTAANAKEAATFSQKGMENVLCVAPGYQIRGAYIGGRTAYTVKNGTSFACPEVAALGVLAKSIDKSMDQTRFMQLLADTAEDLGEAGRDDDFGYGLIDFQAALIALAGDDANLHEEPATEPEIEEPASEPATEPATDPAEEPATEPATQPEVKKVTPSVTLSKTSYVYNGTARRPGVTVRVNGKKLSAADYSISFARDAKKLSAAQVKNVGLYQLTVQLKNDYSGSKTVKFQILPKKTSVKTLKKAKKGFTVKWKKQDVQTTGYQIQYSTVKSFQTKKTVTIKNRKTTSRKISGLKSKKTYYVRVRTYKTVDGKKFYSAWSDVKKIKTR